MFNEIDYEHSDIPALDSETARKLAKQLYDEYVYWKDARLELETVIWPACNDAYLCKRELPKMEAAEWADKSDLGETDFWDGCNYMAQQIALALMPRDQSYLQPVSYESDDQATQNLIRDYMLSLARDCDLRGQFSKHLNQTLRLGSSAISWSWEKKVRLRRMDVAESKLIQEAGAAKGLDLSSRKLRRQRKPEVISSLPVIRPLDMYDVYLDPTGDPSDPEIPMAVCRYISIEELESAVDENGEKLYGNLDGLEPLTVSELYHSNPWKYRNMQIMGVNPMGTNNGRTKYVPVLVFHRLVQKCEATKDQWVDTFFYLAVARSTKNSLESYRLIRIHENPSDAGHRPVFLDTYVDFLSGTPYGIGAVEKSLAAWNAKNVIAALALNAHLVSVFPPLVALTDLLADDRKLKVQPGTFNPIRYKPGVGTNFVAPINVVGNGANEAMTAVQWHGQRILGQMGAYGAILQDPTKSVVRSKTATQINTETASGTTGRDDLLEKITLRSLSPLVQALYDAAIQYSGNEVVNFIREVDGQSTVEHLSPDVLARKRKIVVTGFHGLQNKAQEIEQLQQALQILTTGNVAEVLANAPQLIQELLLKLLGKLGVSNIENYKLSPIETALQDPNVQQQLMQMVQQYAEEVISAAMGGGPMPPPLFDPQQRQQQPQQPQASEPPQAAGVPQ